jgi:hypothetical protein
MAIAFGLAPRRPYAYKIRVSTKWVLGLGLVVVSAVQIALMTLSAPNVKKHQRTSQHKQTLSYPPNYQLHNIHWHYEAMSSTPFRPNDGAAHRTSFDERRSDRPGGDLWPLSTNATESLRMATDEKQQQKQEPDGIFNNFPIYLRNSSKHSLVQCVGDNFQDKTAWIHRSCHYQHLCFDTVEQDFVIYQSGADRQLEEAFDREARTRHARQQEKHRTFARRVLSRMWLWFRRGPPDDQELSQHHDDFVSHQHVAIGGINSKWSWTADGVPRLKWSPRVVQGDLNQDYYELDDNVVLVPYHAFAAQNPGHLLWDEFLPVYTLLRLFALLKNHKVLLLRYMLKDRRVPLWASCDSNFETFHKCQDMYAKFLPLFGLDTSRFTSTQDFRFALIDGSPPKSRLVCANHGAAGLGMLTDHGYKLHGWSISDYDSMHNHGRGSMLYDFRNFMVTNIRLDVPQDVSNIPPYRITLAVGTSRSNKRAFDFTAQEIALKEAFGDHVEVEREYIAQENLKDQIRIASTSAIYVTACGGGAVTATFLPRGASLILYHSEYIEGDFPVRLDWDIFNNMAWIRTHWLPADTMNDDTDLLVKLVARELDVIQNQQLP